MSESAFDLQPLASGIWGLRFDLPGEKVNKLNQKVLHDFKDILASLQSLAGSNKDIQALILYSGKPANFIAGADIKLIQSAKTAEEAEALSRQGHELMNQWEDLPFPTVAAVSGACLGGGCEFSLASSAIVMSNAPEAKIGLPEVLLGILPGMGGCVRLPQKIGLAGALDLILTGKSLDGNRAFRMGLADACLPKEDFLGNTIQWVEKNLSSLQKRKPLGRTPKLGGMGGAIGALLENNPLGRSVIFSQAQKGVLAKTRGHYPAPLEAIDTIRQSGTHYRAGFRGPKRDRALKREAQGFGKLAVTSESANLIRLFFLTEEIKKSNGLPPGKVVEVTAPQTTAVLGAGTMGGGIAQLFADKGVITRMKDINTKGLEIGIQAAARLWKKKLKQRRLNPREYLQKVNLISPVLDYQGFHSADLVVEAVIEKMDIKKKVFQELENHVSSECIIASNTSSLSITEMQTVLKHPERFLGMHFFNPVHRMPLVEIIRGEKTSDQAVATLFAFTKKVGKTPIVVKDGAGFLVNRLLVPYLNEAMYLLGDGASIPEIDKNLLDFGMPMGPIELVDEVGVDVGEKVLKILFEAFGGRMTPAPFAENVTQKERYGKKVGKGFYVYEGSGRPQKRLDPEIYQILGVQPKSGALSQEEIVDRCILPMINEASRCLEEGVVATASDVDLGMIMGTGFPPFRGGLLRFADSVGSAQLVEKLRHYEKKLGARYSPAEPLLKLAQKGTTFYQEYSQKKEQTTSTESAYVRTTVAP